MNRSVQLTKPDWIKVKRAQKLITRMRKKLNDEHKQWCKKR